MSWRRCLPWLTLISGGSILIYCLQRYKNPFASPLEWIGRELLDSVCIELDLFYENKKKFPLLGRHNKNPIDYNNKTLWGKHPVSLGNSLGVSARIQTNHTGRYDTEPPRCTCEICPTLKALTLLGLEFTPLSKWAHIKFSYCAVRDVTFPPTPKVMPPDIKFMLPYDVFAGL